MPQSVSFHEGFLARISAIRAAGTPLVPFLSLAGDLLQTTGKEEVGVTAQIAAVRKIGSSSLKFFQPESICGRVFLSEGI